MDILSKIKLVDNDLVSSIVADPTNFSSRIESPSLILKKYNRTKIEKFIRELKREEDGYILLDVTSENYNKEDLDKFIDLELRGDSKHIYRVVTLSHLNLNKELDFLLSETVVFFTDEKFSLDI